ncbi:hypothetical protein Q5752_003715 [Cryptotrichosporon argae]
MRGPHVPSSPTPRHGLTTALYPSSPHPAGFRRPRLARTDSMGAGATLPQPTFARDHARLPPRSKTPPAPRSLTLSKPSKPLLKLSSATQHTSRNTASTTTSSITTHGHVTASGFRTWARRPKTALSEHAQSLGMGMSGTPARRATRRSGRSIGKQSTPIHREREGSSASLSDLPDVVESADSEASVPDDLDMPSPHLSPIPSDSLAEDGPTGDNGGLWKGAFDLVVPLNDAESDLSVETTRERTRYDDFTVQILDASDLTRVPDGDVTVRTLDLPIIVNGKFSSQGTGTTLSTSQEETLRPHSTTPSPGDPLAAPTHVDFSVPLNDIAAASTRPSAATLSQSISRPSAPTSRRGSKMSGSSSSKISSRVPTPYRRLRTPDVTQPGVDDETSAFYRAFLTPSSRKMENLRLVPLAPPAQAP